MRWIGNSNLLASAFVADPGSSHSEIEAPRGIAIPKAVNRSPFVVLRLSQSND
jgi:hypothetical protein